jgi:hypothetical protein
MRAVPTDVSKLEDIRILADSAYPAFPELAVLLSNAETLPVRTRRAGPHRG